MHKNADVKILARDLGNDFYAIKLYYFFDDEEDEIEIPDEERIVRRQTLMKLFDYYDIPKATKDSEWLLEETEEYVSI